MESLFTGASKAEESQAAVGGAVKSPSSSVGFSVFGEPTHLGDLVVDVGFVVVVVDLVVVVVVEVGTTAACPSGPTDTISNTVVM